MLADHGKDPDTFPNALATMWCYITDDRAEADRILRERVVPTVHRPEDMLRERLPIGPPELFAEKLTAFRKVRRATRLHLAGRRRAASSSSASGTKFDHSSSRNPTRLCTGWMRETATPSGRGPPTDSGRQTEVESSVIASKRSYVARPPGPEGSRFLGTSRPAALKTVGWQVDSGVGDALGSDSPRASPTLLVAHPASEQPVPPEGTVGWICR